MNRLKLVLPNIDHKEILMDYKNEFIKNGDSMDGSAGLAPATTYLAIDENEKLVGMIDIRHRLNEFLLNFGGNIGYSVRKSERRKGYATEMLKLALKKCIELNIKKVLITCNRDNIGSAKTIISNGGILENEIFDPDDNKMTQRYWITLV